MEPINPTKEWYISVSAQRGVPPRCPFATADACPRFYQSLALLGRWGSTSIPEEDDRRLLSKWRGSDLWSLTLEQASAVSGSENSRGFHNFCPEVSFERFGFFAVYLHDFVDEIDTQAAHQQLHREGVSGNDWRWTWMGLTPLHYTECPLYSILMHRSEHGQGSGSAQSMGKPTLYDRVMKRLKGHPVYTAITLLFAVAIGVGSLTDSIEKTAKFAASLFGHRRSDVLVILQEIRLRNEYGVYEDPLFRFIIQNEGSADASLPNLGKIEMIQPETKTYTIKRQPYILDEPPTLLPANTGQRFFDYVEDNHHIAAQLRQGSSVRIRLHVPHIDSEGRVQDAKFDTTLTPSQLPIAE